MPSRYHRTFTSHLRAPADEVWRRVTTMSGVNAELMPLMRMSFPKDAANLDASSMPLGRAGFRSIITLFGLIPFDRSDVTFVEFEPGRRFLERSPMLSQHEWQHERIVTQTETGCEVTDRLTYTPRLPGFIVHWFVGVLFRHRHRVLRRTFGE
jgi:ligand-binding SRPBCC domain-containing protein